MRQGSTPAALALALGVVGIHGVVLYSVTQRSREISIRLALGAQPGALKRMFVRHGLRLGAIGVGCGLALAAALTPLMSSLLFGVSPLDPATYVVVGLALTAAAADPMLALRSD